MATEPAKVRDVVRSPIDRRLLGLLVLVTFFFSVLAVASGRTNARQDHANTEIQHNQQEIRNLAEARQTAIEARARTDYATCVDTAEFHKTFAGLIAEAIRTTEALPVSATNTAAQKAKSLSTLKDLAAHTKIPDCGLPPLPARSP